MVDFKVDAVGVLDTRMEEVEALLVEVEVMMDLDKMELDLEEEEVEEQS